MNFFQIGRERGHGLVDLLKTPQIGKPLPVLVDLTRTQTELVNKENIREVFKTLAMEVDAATRESKNFRMLYKFLLEMDGASIKQFEDGILDGIKDAVDYRLRMERLI